MTAPLDTRDGFDPGSPAEHGGGTPRTSEPADILRFLRKSWIFLVVFALVGTLLALAYAATRVPSYSAKAEIFVSSQAGDTLGERQQGNSYMKARIGSYVQLATSPLVLDEAAGRLESTRTARGLSEMITASIPAESTVLRITAVAADADEAADVANVVVEVLSDAIREVEDLGTSASDPLKITTIETAVPPTAPDGDNRRGLLVAGALGGLLAGAFAAAARQAVDTKVRLVRDLEDLAVAPVIGVLPFDSQSSTRPLVFAAEPFGVGSEAVRTLRTNLEFLDIEGEKTFVVTSSVPGEGKSTTASNLAVALADAGKRVVLVDADLRRPRVAENFGLEGGAGLSDVLVDRARLDDVLRRWGRKSLYILPAGSIPPNPSELLGSEAMSRLLAELAANADVVLIDTPPLLPVTDAALLSRRVSGTILVVRSGVVRRRELNAAIDALRTIQARVAGFVLSAVPMRGPDAYGYGYASSYAATAPYVNDGRRGRTRREARRPSR